MTLYEFKDEYLKVLSAVQLNEETGEYEGLDALDAIQGDFKDKAEAIALFINQLNAEGDAIKADADRQVARAKAKFSKADRLKEYLGFNMLEVGEEKIETTKVALSFRKSEKVVITDDFAIPQMYLRRKVEETPDKTAIKKAIKAGQEVPGAVLEETKNLQIK